jgi:hypothetical protein
MSVKNGRIVLPDGMSYKLLVLQNCVSPSPEIAREVGSYQSLSVSANPYNLMSLPEIKKLKELITMGATVIGPPPAGAAELNNYPESDSQVEKIAVEIWSGLDGKTRTERHLGKGRIIWGKTPREVLLADGVTPDFTFTGQEDKPDEFDYIHRRDDGTDIYFVINRTNQTQIRNFTFRVTGKQPEIWDPVTGKSVIMKAYHQENGSTALSLQLDAFSSYFIVFRRPLSINAQEIAINNAPKLTELDSLKGPWTVKFDPKWGGPAQSTFPQLISWTKSSEEGIKYYSGTATYVKNFDLKQDHSIKKHRIFIDLGDVKSLAEVRLNGKKLGILWCAPWRVEITGAVKEKGNVLEIDVVNLWANRVVHDLSLPKNQRLTKTHDVFRFDMLSVKTPPIESGLLGPVNIISEKN